MPLPGGAVAAVPQSVNGEMRTLSFIGTHADDAPVVTIAADDMYPCDGTAVNFTASVENGGVNVYQWLVNGRAVGGSSPTFSLQNANPKIAAEDEVQCVVTNLQNGLVGSSNKIMGIHTREYHIPTIELYFITNTSSTGTKAFCAGTEVTIGTALHLNYQDATLNYTLQWHVNGVDVPNRNNAFVTRDLKNGDEITCTFHITAKCVGVATAESNTLKVEILPNEAPSVTITPESDVCIGPPITFTASLTGTPGVVNYQWRVNGNPAGSNSAQFSSTNLKNGDVLSCGITNTNGCGISTAVSNEVTIDGAPSESNSVSITSSKPDNIIEENELITFTAHPQYAQNLSYQWTVNGNSAGTNSATFSSATLTLGDKVACTVTTADKCVLPRMAESNVITVVMLVPVVIPNTFTPNADGVNDTWKINALLAYPDCVINIYNRYGSMVYDAKSYTGGWDGTYKGTALPAGTYYYIIKPTKKGPKYSGNVTIIR
ncbi:gliding motility-associated C-terminal domain-containing protein [Mucilaginibacter pedocola]|nr:gliding motility-associated C-terminal domain-containing protein [Mucilaginibacter pedocola]